MNRDGFLFRNEKFLASVAAGKWVLHKSYLEASREAGFFVSEDDHEWGTERDPSKLAMAVRRWRQRLSKEREVSMLYGYMMYIFYKKKFIRNEAQIANIFKES